MWRNIPECLAMAITWRRSFWRWSEPIPDATSDFANSSVACCRISTVFQIDKQNGKAYLRWRAIGSEKSFGAHLTSDGSLRFFALATLLNLPSEKLPDLILLDEPELGLHPAAISLVAGLIKVLSKDKQIMVATQSPLLVDAFGLDEIVVLELRNGKTGIRNVKHDEYRHWLDEYSTGELWQKNLIGGRP